MEGGGLRMAENTGAAVVGGGDDGACPGGIGGGEHGAGDFFRGAKGDGANGRAGAAQECAEGAGGFGGADDLIEKRDQFFPEGLMEMIRESAAQRLIFARGEGRGDSA